jgi:uncharacterized protein YcbX
MLTIRELPRMATLRPRFVDGDRCLQIDTAIESGGSFSLALDGDHENNNNNNNNSGKEVVIHKTTIWRTLTAGVDQGDDVSEFLTQYLESDRPVRLLRIRKDQHKPLVSCTKYAPIVADKRDKGGVARYSDWSSLSILSRQSLEWLGEQKGCEDLADAARFRPNIVVDAPGRLGHCEDNWLDFDIGSVRFEFLKQCGRCLVPTVNPKTAVRDRRIEPLRTLKKKRSGKYPFLDDSQELSAFFMTNVRHICDDNTNAAEQRGVLRVGDTLVVH